MNSVLVHGDCLKVLQTVEPLSIDLILTDPPYGMDYQSSRRVNKMDKIQQDNNIDWFEPFIQEAYRILKDNSHIYIFCNDYSISEFRNLMERVGFKVKRTLVWVKNNHTSGDLDGDYGNKTEFILYAQKGRKDLIGKRETNVLLYDRVSNLVHPTEKPLSLCSFLIQKSSKEGDLILDPFCGSGTTIIAAKQLRRNYFGIEINSKYVDIANMRLKQEILL